MRFAATVPVLTGWGERGERFVVRTIRLPKSAGVASRVMTTIGGHVGAVVGSAIVHQSGEDMAAVHCAQISDACECLRGTAWMSAAEAYAHLMARESICRMSAMTPALVAATARAVPEHEPQSLIHIPLIVTSLMILITSSEAPIAFLLVGT